MVEKMQNILHFHFLDTYTIHISYIHGVASFHPITKVAFNMVVKKVRMIIRGQLVALSRSLKRAFLNMKLWLLTMKKKGVLQCMTPKGDL
jgi:hypothetical protein